MASAETLSPGTARRDLELPPEGLEGRPRSAGPRSTPMDPTANRRDECGRPPLVPPRRRPYQTSTGLESDFAATSGDSARAPPGSRGSLPHDPPHPPQSAPHAFAEAPRVAAGAIP